MNIKEYIASGILEAYVLGELTTVERAEVEQYLLEYPELRSELTRVEETQEQLLMATALTPRAGVKEKLMSKLQQPAAPATNVISLDSIKRQLNTWRWVAAASISVAVITTYLATSYHHRWKDSEISLNELLAQNRQMAQDYNQVNQRLDDLESSFNIVNNPSFRRVVMKGTAHAPEALASVYWNESSHDLYLTIQNLKELAHDQQYQLWAIVDGKPVDAGVFDAGNGLLKMKQIAGAAAFAVTIERRGGSATPALETMQVMGNS